MSDCTCPHCGKYYDFAADSTQDWLQMVRSRWFVRQLRRWQVSDCTCPHCGKYYDFAAEWRQRNKPDSFVIQCDDCQTSVGVTVTFVPVFEADKEDDDE